MRVFVCARFWYKIWIFVCFCVFVYFFLVSEQMPGRDDVQCFHRFHKTLTPGVISGAWDRLEDIQLMLASRAFPGLFALCFFLCIFLVCAFLFFFCFRCFFFDCDFAHVCEQLSVNKMHCLVRIEITPIKFFLLFWGLRSILGWQ